MSIQPDFNPYVKQLYDTMLDKAILDVQNAFSVNNGELFWDSLRKLVVMVREKDEREKLDKFLKETEKFIDMEMSKATYTHADKLVRIMWRNRFKMDKGLEFFDLILGALNTKGYLKSPGVIGRNPNPKHIRQESEENKNE